MLKSRSRTGQPLDPTRTASRKTTKTALQMRKLG
jgi:hypothetical protein